MLKTQITNSCTCTDENGEPTLYDCYGCWHDVVNEFTSDTEEFFNLATHTASFVLTACHYGVETYSESLKWQTLRNYSGRLR